MGYKALWEEEALDDLAGLDKPVAKKIVDKVENHLIKDPLKLGKKLTEQFSGFYRYRYSKWRVIYRIEQDKKIIRIYRVGHRGSIYDKGSLYTMALLFTLLRSSINF